MIWQNVLKVQSIYQKYIFHYSVDYTNIRDVFGSIWFRYSGTLVEADLH